MFLLHANLLDQGESMDRGRLWCVCFHGNFAYIHLRTIYKPENIVPVGWTFRKSRTCALNSDTFLLGIICFFKHLRTGDPISPVSRTSHNFGESGGPCLLRINSMRLTWMASTIEATGTSHQWKWSEAKDTEPRTGPTAQRLAVEAMWELGSLLAWGATQLLRGIDFSQALENQNPRKMQESARLWSSNLQIFKHLRPLKPMLGYTGVYPAKRTQDCSPKSQNGHVMRNMMLEQWI